MKFSELWLREWVNPAIDSDALANQITMAGLEVDGVEPVAGSFHGVVVGEVVECAQHPNADKLRVTKVNVGGERLLDPVQHVVEGLVPAPRDTPLVVHSPVGGVAECVGVSGEPINDLVCSRHVMPPR